MKKSVNIAQVAAASGVSKTTISRYLNGRYEYMSEKTRRRIEEVISKLDYRPNYHARSLKSNRSGLIGVTVADITSPFSSILVKAIGDYCSTKDVQIVVGSCDDDPIKERRYIESFIDYRVDGLIINTVGGNDEFLMSTYSDEIPIVLADRAIGVCGIDTVTTKNYETTLSMLQHLRSQGYKKIYLFTQKVEGNLSRVGRRDTFIEFMNSCGFDAESLVYLVDVSNPQAVAAAIKEIMTESQDGPPAIFAVNGVTLLAVVEQVVQMGISMPNELGVCGYDDWAWTQLIPPGITAIAQPTYEIGRETSKMLLSRISSKRTRKPREVELPSTIHLRGSTDLKGKDS